MFKLVVFTALVAVATARPSVLAPAPFAYSAPAIAAPLAYSTPFISSAAYAYSAPAVAYSAPAVAYSAPAVAAVPAPVTYATGHEVSYAVEPVEQHGYQIAY